MSPGPRRHLKPHRFLTSTARRRSPSSSASLSQLAYWAWIVPPQERYRRFQVRKRSGSVRHIDAPATPLKRIQRALATAFTDAYRAPAHVHGFTPGRSPLTNASVHIGQAWVFAVDLEDFFGTITTPRVAGLFRHWPFDYPEEVAELLAELCCHDGELPQGAPTSPIISNYICRGMDRKLAELAIGHRCYFTRYADDLVFSTDRRAFPTTIAVSDGGRARPSLALQAIIKDGGFRINEQKTRMQVSFGRQRVTGLIVNEKLNVPRSYLRGLRALLYIWKRYGPEDASRSLRRVDPDPNWPPGKPYPGLALVARGRLSYIGSVRGTDDPAYLKLAAKLDDLDPHFQARAPAQGRKLSAHLYTEGRTDHEHVGAALAHFHGHAEFTDLELLIDEETDRGNDQKLAEYCRSLQEFGSDGLAVCLFDTDTSAALKAIGPHGWQAYGPKVVAVGLAAPPWRQATEKLCIEMLYTDSDLRTEDEGGRRIFLTTEFDPTTSLHKDGERCALPHAGATGLVAQTVYAFDSDGNIARSKASFAKAVRDDPGSLGPDLFEGFRPTFERIEAALATLPAQEATEA